MNFFNAVSVSHGLLKDNIKKGSVCIDATCGNGNDTLLLCELCGKDGYVYAFDIQKQACINTSSLLRRNKITSAKVICDSHENVDAFIKKPVDCAVFNLGYLPKSDSNISTHPISTISALKKIMALLKKDGIIVMCAYVGHSGGMREYSKITKFLNKMQAQEFQTLIIDQPNAKKLAPKVIFIKKKVDF
jgi:predicted methyltransferase